MKLRKVRVATETSRLRRKDSSSMLIVTLSCLLLCFMGTLAVVSNIAVSGPAPFVETDEVQRYGETSAVTPPHDDEKIRVLVPDNSDELLLDLSNVDASFIEIDLYVTKPTTFQWQRGPIHVVANPTLADLTDRILVLSTPLHLSQSIHFLLEASKHAPNHTNIVGICADTLSTATPHTLTVASRTCKSTFLLTSSGRNAFQETNAAHWHDLSSLILERDLFVLFPGPNTTNNLLPFPTEVTFTNREVSVETEFAARNRDGLEKLLSYVRRGSTGRIFLSVINRNFVEFARSWMCNMELLKIDVSTVVWVATDAVAWEAMRAVKGVEVFLLQGMSGAEDEERGSTYGTPGYWDLMLSRAKLVRELLNRGVSVLLFDADQVWLKSPMEDVNNAIVDPDVDVVGTVVSMEEVGGNFVFLRATNRTLVMYSALCDMFEEDYLKHGMDKKDSSTRGKIRNDQTILSSFVHKNEKWRGIYQCKFHALDRDLFLDGRWYKGAYRSNPRTHNPTIINNNYIEGNNDKIIRAIKFGHWFLAQDNQTCSMPNPVKGLQ